MEYGKQPRYFVYDSSRLGDLDSFANSSDLQIMVINSQAFNAKGKMRDGFIPNRKVSVGVVNWRLGSYESDYDYWWTSVCWRGNRQRKD